MPGAVAVVVAVLMAVIRPLRLRALQSVSELAVAVAGAVAVVIVVLVAVIQRLVVAGCRVIRK